MVPEALRRRTDWYILIFNTCNLSRRPWSPGPCSTPRTGSSAGWAAGAALGLLAFLLLHYGLLAGVLHLARGVRLRDTIRLDCVLIDAGLLARRDRGRALERLSGARRADAPAAGPRLSLPCHWPSWKRRGSSPRRPLQPAPLHRRAWTEPAAPAASTGRSPSSSSTSTSPEINTAQGYAAGDRAFVAVAEALRSATWVRRRRYFGVTSSASFPSETNLDGARRRRARSHARRGVDAAARTPRDGLDRGGLPRCRPATR